MMKTGRAGLLPAIFTAAAFLVSATAYGADDSAAKKDACTAEKKDENDRTVRLTGSINVENAIKVIDQLRALSKKDPKAPIELRINSPGGDVGQSLAILDVINSLPNRVDTVCEGYAVSAGAFILAANERKRQQESLSPLYHHVS